MSVFQVPHTRHIPFLLVEGKLNFQSSAYPCLGTLARRQLKYRCKRQKIKQIMMNSAGSHSPIIMMTELLTPFKPSSSSIISNSTKFFYSRYFKLLSFILFLTTVLSFRIFIAFSVKVEDNFPYHLSLFFFVWKPYLSLNSAPAQSHKHCIGRNNLMKDSCFLHQHIIIMYK